MVGPMPLQERPQADPCDSHFLADVAAGQVRLSSEQAATLYHQMPLAELGRWADARCRAVHGDSIRTFVIDRNINYTNVCTAKCTFCAFRRDAEDEDAYTLTNEVILEKVAELTAIGGNQILMQGGMNPDLPLSWYETLLGQLGEQYPDVHVHAFSPPEIFEFVNFFDPPGSDFRAKVKWVLE